MVFKMGKIAKKQKKSGKKRSLSPLPIGSRVKIPKRAKKSILKKRKKKKVVKKKEEDDSPRTRS